MCHSVTGGSTLSPGYSRDNAPPICVKNSISNIKIENIRKSVHSNGLTGESLHDVTRATLIARLMLPRRGGDSSP